MAKVISCMWSPTEYAYGHSDGSCKQRAGTLREERDTIFGAREDMEVLSGRARIYG